jgi:DNA-binding transcriptional regulator YiaG
MPVRPNRGTVARTAADEGEAPVIVGLAEAAIELHACALGSLPDPGANGFQHRADEILSGLRKDHEFLREAAGRTRSTPSVIVALGEVRGRYHDLMTKAAAAPGSNLGHQLYVTRRRAQLTIDEIATGLGLQANLIEAWEAGHTPSPSDAVTIRELIGALEGSLSAETRPAVVEADPESADESEQWTESAS